MGQGLGLIGLRERAEMSAARLQYAAHWAEVSPWKSSCRD